MQFNISSYIDDLRQSLNGLSAQAKTAFAVWCANALLTEKVLEYLAAKAGLGAVSSLTRALDYLWNCASGRVKPRESQLLDLEQACGELAWDELKITDDEQAMNIYAIEAISSLVNALNACATTSALSAAKAAESVINKLDRQLSEELFVDSYTEPIFSNIQMKAEFQRHEKMVQFLQGHSGLTFEQRFMFRENKGDIGENKGDIVDF